jgi:hypothetical protein
MTSTRGFPFAFSAEARELLGPVVALNDAVREAFPALAIGWADHSTVVCEEQTIFFFSVKSPLFSDLVQLFSELEKPALFFRSQATFFRSIYSDLAFSTVHTPLRPVVPGRIHPQIPNPTQKWFFLCPQARRWPPDGPAETATNFRSHNNNFQIHQQQISEVITTIFRAINNKFQKS